MRDEHALRAEPRQIGRQRLPIRVVRHGFVVTVAFGDEKIGAVGARYDAIHPLGVSRIGQRTAVRLEAQSARRRARWMRDFISRDRGLPDFHWLSDLVLDE